MSAIQMRPHKFQPHPNLGIAICWKCDQPRTSILHGPEATTLKQKASISELAAPGDFCFTDDGRVIMACPLCGGVFACPHVVVQTSPLTLSPSVVGSKDALSVLDAPIQEQVLGPCGHHFWVKDGRVIDAM